MEKRALIAVVLSMAVFVIWGFVFTEPRKPETSGEIQSGTKEVAENIKEKQTKTETVESEQQKPRLIETTETPAAKTDAFKAETVSVETELYKAVFTESGGRLKSLALKKYLTAKEPDSPPKELVVVGETDKWPLGLRFRKGEQPGILSGRYKSSTDKITLDQSNPTARLTMVYQNDDGFELERIYTFHNDTYLIDLQVNIKNHGDKTIDDNLILDLTSEPITTKDRYAGFAAYIDNNLLEVKPNDLEDDLDDLNKKNYELTWASYADQYFMAAIIPKDQERTRVTAKKFDKNGVEIEFINPPLVMSPQTKMTYSYTIFYGPKDYKVLKSMNNDLDRSIYFGWFDILAKPLLIMMTWLYGYVKNYGVVIIIITVLIKIIFWPLTAKSYKSMKSMQKLQPKIMKLREKYKDDRQAMNAEMMQLYRTYKVNPMGGCLPMVIQIPVFIALYRLLDYSLELRHAPFWLWITDLSAPDRLFHFSFTIPFMDPPAGIPILTLLMGAGMVIQQKMTPTPGDPTQAKIMMLMPVFFTVIFINFPSGLVLYWLVNNILSIGQQTLINKRPS